MTWKNLISRNERREKHRTFYAHSTTNSVEIGFALDDGWRLNVLRVFVEKLGHWLSSKNHSPIRILSRDDHRETYLLLPYISTKYPPYTSLLRRPLQLRNPLWNPRNFPRLFRFPKIDRDVSETFLDKLFIHQRSLVVAAYSVSMIEEVINVNSRNTSSLKGRLIETPSRQRRFALLRAHTSTRNPLYPRSSPMIAGKGRGKNIAPSPSPLVGLSLRDINIIARVKRTRVVGRVRVSYVCTHVTSTSRWKAAEGWVAGWKRWRGGCIGENSSRSKYCNIWRDSYEFRVTPPAPSTFHTFHFLDTSLKYCRGSTGLPLLGARSMGSVKEKGEEEEGACVCSGSFLDLHERPFPPSPPPTTPSPSLISTRVSVILGYVRVRGCTGFLASSREGCLGFQKDGSLC